MNNPNDSVQKLKLSLVAEPFYDKLYKQIQYYMYTPGRPIKDIDKDNIDEYIVQQYNEFINSVRVEQIWEYIASKIPDELDDGLMDVLSSIPNFDLNRLWYLIGDILPNYFRCHIWRWYFNPKITEYPPIQEINTNSYEEQSLFKTIHKILKEYFIQLECIPGLSLSIYIIVKSYLLQHESEEEEEEEDDDNVNELMKEKLIYYTILLSSVFYKSPSDMNIIYQYLDLIIENYNWEIGYDETQEFLNQLNDEKFLWFYNTFDSEDNSLIKDILNKYFLVFFQFMCVKSFSIEITRFIWDQLVLLDFDYTIIIKAICTFLIIIKNRINNITSVTKIQYYINKLGHQILPSTFVDVFNQLYLYTIKKEKEKEIVFEGDDMFSVTTSSSSKPSLHNQNEETNSTHNSHKISSKSSRTAILTAIKEEANEDYKTDDESVISNDTFNSETTNSSPVSVKKSNRSSTARSENISYSSANESRKSMESKASEFNESNSNNSGEDI